MRVEFLNEDMTEAVVRRRTFPIFGTYVEAVVQWKLLGKKRRYEYLEDDETVEDWDWAFSTGERVLARVRAAITSSRRRLRLRREAAVRERNWRPVRAPQTRLAPARLVKS